MSKHTKDPFEVQISISYTAPKGYEPSASLLQKIVRRWAENPDSVPTGFDVNVVRWRNPARKGSGANWRYPKNYSEKQCELVRRALRYGATVTITTMGNS